MFSNFFTEAIADFLQARRVELGRLHFLKKIKRNKIIKNTNLLFFGYRFGFEVPRSQRSTEQVHGRISTVRRRGDQILERHE